jgi:hypothetical protein
MVDTYAIGADCSLQVLLVAGPATSIRHRRSITICCAELSEEGVEWPLNREHGFPNHTLRHVTVSTLHFRMGRILCLRTKIAALVA